MNKLRLLAITSLASILSIGIISYNNARAYVEYVPEKVAEVVVKAPETQPAEVQQTQLKQVAVEPAPEPVVVAPAPAPVVEKTLDEIIDSMTVDEIQQKTATEDCLKHITRVYIYDGVGDAWKERVKSILRDSPNSMYLYMNEEGTKFCNYYNTVSNLRN